MTATFQQDDMKIALVGTVTPPPTIEDVLFLLEHAASIKAGVELTPAQARVLHDYLEAF